MSSSSCGGDLAECLHCLKLALVGIWATLRDGEMELVTNRFAIDFGRYSASPSLHFFQIQHPRTMSAIATHATPEEASEHRTGKKRPAPRGSASYSRKRAVTACQVCRARRTKCDNLKPSCSFCLKVGAKCIQSPVDLSSFDPASLQILQRLDELEQLVRRIGPQHREPQESSIIPSAEEDIDRSRLLPSSIEHILQWDHLRINRLPTQPDGPAFPSTTHPVAQTTTSPLSGVDEMEPHKTKMLLDNFFNYVHVKNPILDEQKTRQLVSRVCMHGMDWSAESCRALLVCALGTIATPFLHGNFITRDSDVYKTGESFFLAAKKRLGLVLGTSSLIEAQCVFLAGVYTMCTFQRMASWRFFLQALACCQNFDFLKSSTAEHGMLEDIDSASGSSSNAAEQAIYWSSWKSEREMRSELEPRDFPISEANTAVYPPFFPTPPRHDSHFSGAVNSETEGREQISWYFYLSEISLLRLRRRKAKDMTEFEPADGESLLRGLARTIAHHEEQVLEWQNALPAEMALSAPPAEDDICRFVLRGHLINVYESLYWPFVDWAINSSQAYSNGDGLLEDLANKGLRTHVERVCVNRPGFHHRHHGTFGMIRSCNRSALVLLAAAYSCSSFVESHGTGGKMRFELQAGWEEAVRDVIQLNKDWEHECPDLSKMTVELDSLCHNH